MSAAKQKSQKHDTLPLAVLLGAQRFDPTLGDIVKGLEIQGKVAVITAGWQERESEDDDLTEALEGRSVNLTLHARGEQLFKADVALAQAHSERQVTLRRLQDIYRLRLEHALEAEREVRESGVPESLREEVEAATVDAIRSLDAWHLQQCARVRAQFDEKFAADKRPSIVRHHDELLRLIDDCEAVAIAGGHVAVLTNRLLMFGLNKLIGTRTLFAWSAGAMAVCERVVLFHDDPPQGKAACEVLDAGLGLVKNVVAFPEPERRLHLADADHVKLLARRFAPARCLTFPARSSVFLKHGHLSRSSGVQTLSPSGEVDAA